jgi:hypothetical protein
MNYLLVLAATLIGLSLLGWVGLLLVIRHLLPLALVEAAHTRESENLTP